MQYYSESAVCFSQCMTSYRLLLCHIDLCTHLLPLIGNLPLHSSDPLSAVPVLEACWSCPCAGGATVDATSAASDATIPASAAAADGCLPLRYATAGGLPSTAGRRVPSPPPHDDATAPRGPSATTAIGSPRRGRAAATVGGRPATASAVGRGTRGQARAHGLCAAARGGVLGRAPRSVQGT